MPTKIEFIQGQLTALHDVLRLAKAYGTPDQASKLAMDSLLREEDLLTTQLKQARMVEAGTVFELRVEGDPVVGHSVNIEFLGSLLMSFQKLMNAVAQVTISEPTARGSVADSVISQSRLRLSTTFASSFGMELTLADPQQPTLFKEGFAVAEEVCSLLNGDAEPLAALHMIAHSRIRRHYVSLMELLSKAGASVTVFTQHRPVGSRLSASQARDRVAWLELQNVSRGELAIEGALVAGNLDTGTFEIKTESGVNYQGYFSPEAAEEMRQLKLGALATATLEVTSAEHEDAAFSRQDSYRLISVRLAETSTVAR